MSVSSTRVVSFLRLFKQLVSAASSPKGQVSKGIPYTKFRTVLAGMLESFRPEGNMLVITKHLVDRDVSELVEERSKGWAPAQNACNGCGAAFTSKKATDDHGRARREAAGPTSER